MSKNAAPPRRSIYVRGYPGLQLSLDGPAMRIEQPAKAPVWVPMARLDLLMIGGSLTLDVNLLHRLASAGVAVRLCDASGAECTTLLAAQRGGHEDLSASLDSLQQDPGWQAGYAHWRLREDLWALLRISVEGIKLCKGLRELRPLLAAQRLLTGGSAAAILPKIGPWLAAEAMEVLVEYRWPFERLSQPRPGPHPQCDLVRAMLWEAIGLLRQRGQPTTSADQWYLQHRQRLHAQGRTAMAQFLRWVAARSARRFDPEQLASGSTCGSNQP